MKLYLPQKRENFPWNIRPGTNDCIIEMHKPKVVGELGMNNASDFFHVALWVTPTAWYGKARLGSAPSSWPPRKSSSSLHPCVFLLFVPHIWHLKCFVFLVTFPEFMLAHDLAVCSLGGVFKGHQVHFFFFFFFAWLPDCLSLVGRNKDQLYLTSYLNNTNHFTVWPWPVLSHSLFIL